MSVLFVGSFFPGNRKNEIWKNSKGPIVFSADTFQQSLIDGWRRNNSEISLLTLPCIGSFPKRYRHIYFRKSFIKDGFCGGFLNITLIKNLSIYYSVKKNVKKWIEKIKDEKIILVYGMIPSYLQAVISLKKKNPEIKISVIVLDLPEYFDDKTDFLSKYISKITTKWCYSNNEFIDSYILLTKYMRDKLDVGVKPWMLLEGIYSLSFECTSLVKKEDKKVVLYTGKLDARFGIENLLKAFLQISDDKYELWICGEGLSKKNVLKLVEVDKRIKYFGLLKREDVLILQKKATVLINPRQFDSDYTKFSFPSKTMEYMASGTPTIMYKLPGIPDEYLEYLIIVKDNTIQTLKDTIVEWCEKSSEELFCFGNKSQRFIKECKNSSVQAMRVYDFIRLKAKV